MMRKLIGLFIVCLGIAAIFTACPPPDAEPCTVDADCFSEEICVEGSCQGICESAEECPDGDECVARPGEGDEMYCQAGCFDDTDCDEGVCYNGDTCVPTCESAEDCSGDEICEVRDDSDTDDSMVCQEPEVEGCTENEDCEDNEICVIPDGEDVGECEPTDEDQYFTILVEDVTSEHGETGRCDDSTYGYDTAGAKPFAIELYEGTDLVSNAFAVDFVAGDNTNFGDPYLIFDGTANDFTHTCPDPETIGGNDDPGEPSTFHEDAVVALGCGGQLFVQFLDDNDEPIELTEDHQVDVLVYGSQCTDEFNEEHDGDHDPQSTDDPYIVDACTDGSDGPIDIDTCNAPLSGDAAEGINTFDVVFP